MMPGYLSRHAPKPHAEVERHWAAQVMRLKERWRCFSLPVQAGLQEHLNRWGFEAAEHCTWLLERAGHR
jgi:hypothetical protein